MSDLPRIGFIGLGLMGTPMARHILQAGYPLTTMAHRRRKALDDLLALGACEGFRPADVAAASDIVLLCLPGTPQVEATLCGEGGLLDAAKEGLIIADCSTAEPSGTRRLAQAAAARGVVFVDAPLTRTPKEAEAGRLNLLFGGPDEVLKRLRPVFETFAENIFPAGDVGSAHSLKLVNNFLSLGTAGLIAEAVTAARRLGVAPERLFEVVSAGGANSNSFQKIMPYHLEGDASGLRFSLKNATKDLGYFAQATAAQGLPSPIAQSIHQSYLTACALGHGEDYVTQLGDAWKAWDPNGRR